MKKILFVLILAVVTCSYVFAEDIIKVLSVYSSGVRTAIPLAGIDSLDHSLLDADSIQHSEYTSSIIHAIDQDYQIPISNIDSIVIGEIDVEQYNSQINEIQNYIDEQTDLEVDAFQTNLLNWLNANENIQEATINENKDFISVKFKNGLDFSICFQDISIFEGAEESVEAKALRKASEDEEGEVYDVSYQEGEEIIESPKILYIQGLDFILSNAQDEKNKIHNECDLSPMKINIKQIDKNLTFVNEDFSDYGLVLITQTHGFGYSKGSFSVKRDLSPNASVNPSYFSLQALEESTKALVVYTKYKDDILKTQIVPNDPFFNHPISSLSTPVYLIRPSLIEKKLYGNHQAILYGSFCWSERMSASVKNNTVVGYKNPAHYFYCWKALTKFIEEMTLGNTVDDALNLVEKEDYFKWGYNPQLTLRRGYDKSSKQRYFSITSNEITKKAENGNPIITGTINGYKNLKSGLTPVVYVHEGEESFDPDDSDVDCVQGEFIKNGTFTCEYNKELKPGTKYGFIIGFEYDYNVYYGEVKYFTKKGDNICPDENHPHMIDLGLPSGTKWCCCNEEANSPEEYGGYYAWGETDGNKEEYSIMSYEHKKEADRWEYLDDPWYGDINVWFSYIDENDYSVVFLAIDDIGSEISNTSYDVAYVKSEGNRRMPTESDYRELGTVCKSQETTYNGINGCIITGPNGNKLFLPAAGFRHEEGYGNSLGGLSSAVGLQGSYSYYWTGTINKVLKPYSQIFYFDKLPQIVSHHRLDGLPVRGVSK